MHHIIPTLLPFPLRLAAGGAMKEDLRKYPFPVDLLFQDPAGRSR